MDPSIAADESLNRQKFLEKYIKIKHGHWGGSWLLRSSPTINGIIFDENFTYAKILYRSGYSGGEALMKKTDGKWEFVSKINMWIE
ncbi:hypothetical protein [Mucilaginibacter myungsuensis]|uniref:Uncharacterized protein n=1 Tax=Mucilaginibacter myungsuensis TaxID=649104 RepID=A0A929PXT6_9SPHI|nr:hypothetical protein [Mucilaginibacter myungsuensis]MBE9664203.1 hypothetical protein [Mucilaginibacter myungsuensis]MDN3599905.1 hypothetical protein [Mucilaginibacter myungsuensis]